MIENKPLRWEDRPIGSYLNSNIESLQISASVSPKGTQNTSEDEQIIEHSQKKFPLLLKPNEEYMDKLKPFNYLNSRNRYANTFVEPEKRKIIGNGLIKIGTGKVFNTANVQHNFNLKNLKELKKLKNDRIKYFQPLKKKEVTKSS